ncbi:hypothetical protein WR25_14516 [Diploscapter pachys]|uniref:WW domain-containing protein n=1 Tax=Diploscapter pachys TaxID=2018661 RepID=A0A2A2JU39_9BILA|nr:hypothetical protein WR25_14516 [Diploscapter pachys]
MADPDYGTDSDMPELMPELEAEPDESTNGAAMTLKSILEGATSNSTNSTPVLSPASTPKPSATASINIIKSKPLDLASLGIAPVPSAKKAANPTQMPLSSKFVTTASTPYNSKFTTTGSAPSTSKFVPATSSVLKSRFMSQTPSTSKVIPFRPATATLTPGTKTTLFSAAPKYPSFMVRNSIHTIPGRSKSTQTQDDSKFTELGRRLSLVDLKKLRCRDENQKSLVNRGEDILKAVYESVSKIKKALGPVAVHSPFSNISECVSMIAGVSRDSVHRVCVEQRPRKRKLGKNRKRNNNRSKRRKSTSEESDHAEEDDEDEDEQEREEIQNNGYDIFEDVRKRIKQEENEQEIEPEVKAGIKTEIKEEVMLPGYGGFPIVTPALQLAAQQQIAQAQLLAAQRRMLLPGVSAASAVSTGGLLNVSLPTTVATAGRPAPMLVPPGMANTEDATDSSRSTMIDAQWCEARTADGRVYYYHKLTRETSWTKPDGAKTPQERASSTPSSSTIWKRFTSPEGRSYYYNMVTKVTTWEKPEGFVEPGESGGENKGQQSEEGQKSNNPLAQIQAAQAQAAAQNPASASSHNAAAQKASAIQLHIPSTLSSVGVIPQSASILPSGMFQKFAPTSTKEEPKGESEIEKAMKATLASLTANSSASSSRAEELLAGSEADLKRRQGERFRELLRDKYNDSKISANCNWEQAVKFIQHDPRFRIIQKISEKKQLFNQWKIQKQKEERDEKRLSAKRAKEQLEKFLQTHTKVKETLKYSKACDLFSREPIWTAVPSEDRHDIFKDVIEFVTKRDKEKKKEVRQRNISALAAILHSMEKISYKTTWAQAQRLLIENPQFADDTTLQSMDKEDALIVFEEHIKQLEKDHEEEKENEDNRIKRQERKVREAFQQFLVEMHKKGELTSMSLWSSLYPIISTDYRFDAMLTQTGSTPLDLFKFYVEELKDQYGEDRKIIKEILAQQDKIVKADTQYEEFFGWVTNDQKGAAVDQGNMKFVFNSLIEKAENKKNEVEREESRKKRRLEGEFRNLLRLIQPPVDANTEWQTIRPKLEKEKAYLVLEDDEARERCFEEYKVALAESCGHHHSSSKKKKKEKKKKSRKSDKDSESEGEIRERKKKKKRSRDRDRDGSDDEGKKKKKRKRSATRSRSGSPDTDTYYPEEKKKKEK